MAVFVLIHGAWHGAWCWANVAAELEAIGQRSTAVELPCADPDATFSTYAEVVSDALDDEPDDVTLVAHSMGGMSAPLVAAMRPVSQIAMVCAVIPEPGRSYYQRLEAGEDMHPPELGPGMTRDDLGRSVWVDERAAIRDLYADCDSDTAHAAARRLRPQPVAPYREPCPLASLPSVRYRYLLCREDRIVASAWARNAASAQLGVEPTEWDGSHSPMLAHPKRLARWLASDQEDQEA